MKFDFFFSNNNFDGWHLKCLSLIVTATGGFGINNLIPPPLHLFKIIIISILLKKNIKKSRVEQKDYDLPFKFFNYIKINIFYKIL